MNKFYLDNIYKEDFGKNFRSCLSCSSYEIYKCYGGADLLNEYIHIIPEDMFNIYYEYILKEYEQYGVSFISKYEIDWIEVLLKKDISESLRERTTNLIEKVRENR